MTGAWRRCAVDGVELVPPWREPATDNYVLVLRDDARYCSPRCRQAARRARLGLPSGWVGTSPHTPGWRRRGGHLAVTGRGCRR